MCLQSRDTEIRYRWICRSKECEHAISEDQFKLCTYDSDQQCKLCGASAPNEYPPDWTVVWPLSMTDQEWRRLRFVTLMDMCGRHKFWEFEPYLNISMFKLDLKPKAVDYEPWANKAKVESVFEDESKAAQLDLDEHILHLERAYYTYMFHRCQKEEWRGMSSTKQWLMSRAVHGALETSKAIIHGLKVKGESEDSEVYQRVDLACQGIDIRWTDVASPEKGGPYGIAFSPGRLEHRQQVRFFDFKPGWTQRTSEATLRYSDDLLKCRDQLRNHSWTRYDKEIWTHQKNVSGVTQRQSQYQADTKALIYSYALENRDRRKKAGDGDDDDEDED